MEAEGFSVVVPTHNRSDLVAELLRTLDVARANFEGEVEVLVLDSSPGDAAHAISNMCVAHGARYLRDTNHVGKKRNLGIREARCKYVLFTDSDCEVMPDLFSQHAQAYASADEGIGGILGVTTVFGDTAPIWQTLRLDSSFTAAFAFARFMESAPWGTCTNLSFRRDILLQVGGFDETWPLAVYGEDVDLGIRVSEAGFQIKCNRQAIVRHNSSSVSSIRGVLRKKYHSGRADYYLGRRHSDHLAAEYPGWAAVGLLLFLVLIGKSLITKSPMPLLLLPLAICGGVLLQSVLTAKAGARDLRLILRQAGVILFEATFETGRLVEALRHGDVRRLWTKFVYASRQLIGEREKRIRQAWAWVLVMVALLCF